LSGWFVLHLARVKRTPVKWFITRKREEKPSREYVKLMISVLSALLAAGRDGGLPVRLDLMTLACPRL
jgi:hypothetical protein